MDITPATVWWVLAGLAIAVELASGTFYLLMIALGLAAGAIAGHLGLAVPLQIVAAALVGGGATVVWHWRRDRGGPGLANAQNPAINLDVGDRVHVEAWSVDRTARVQHRGTQWSARLAPDAMPAVGQHFISAVEGNWLVLTPLQRD
jgi:membrane protein implicated in regulation of membrane protease activity